MAKKKKAKRTRTRKISRRGATKKVPRLKPLQNPPFDGDDDREEIGPLFSSMSLCPPGGPFGL